MKFLTDEEISLMAFNDCPEDWNNLHYKDCWIEGYKEAARAIEQAILERIGEPVAWSHNNGHIQCDGVGVPSHLYTVENGWTPLFAIRGVE